MTACRLIIDAPKSGAENMAIDEAILLGATARKQSTLRVYRWCEPTLSLGYFQRYSDREGHAASLACPCIRRHSGGGAILHDHELTYSLILPVADRWSSQANDLYALVHQSLMDWFCGLGVSPKLAVNGDQSPFLCFQRRSEGDVVVANHKIVGSAQRRHRGALLQHGSILMQQSERAPELPGLFDTGMDSIDIETFAVTCAEKIASALQWAATRSRLDDEEIQRAAELVQQKFSSQAWTTRR